MNSILNDHQPVPPVGRVYLTGCDSLLDCKLEAIEVHVFIIQQLPWLSRNGSFRDCLGIRGSLPLDQKGRESEEGLDVVPCFQVIETVCYRFVLNSETLAIAVLGKDQMLAELDTSDRLKELGYWFVELSQNFARFTSDGRGGGAHFSVSKVN
ncbi:MAG: hypothetical protein ABF379_13765 [Akkermansiaceae bacterium]